MAEILHLSDVHFGLRQKDKGHESVHRFKDKKTGNPNPFWLAEILNDKHKNRPPDIVVLSGDLGWSGSSKDYSYALKFIRHLQDKWENSKFVILPGNHDVDISIKPEDWHRQAAFVEFAKKVYGKHFEQIYPLLGRARDGAYDPALLVGFHHIITESKQGQKSDQILVVAVNSAAHISKDGTPVYISSEILNKITRFITDKKFPENVLRIFAIHHHLLPFIHDQWEEAIDPGEMQGKPDPSIVLNSAELQDWLGEHNFHLVLHGHKHRSHGREDVLWQSKASGKGRRLLIVGAGSSGVIQGERASGEPLSYNLLTIKKISSKRWSTLVDVLKISEAGGEHGKADLTYRYTSKIGDAPEIEPLIFQAERLDDCHGAIADHVRQNSTKLIRNFVSIVENSDYIHPPTTCIGITEVTEADVKSSFESLHPEFSFTKGWENFKGLDDFFQELGHRFQFQHGPRLFGTVRKARDTVNVDVKYRPIVKAMKGLGSGDSHAYVSLYNPEVDVFGEGKEPLPGLMSIQFIPDPDDKRLDVVATFRKIELSFWWVVNMYEISRLLQWAVGSDYLEKDDYLPGRITVFAALAEWKENPAPFFTTLLDNIELSKITQIVAGAARSKMASLIELTNILKQKRDHTNDTNLNETGLRRLVDLLDGHKNGMKNSEIKKLFTKVAEKCNGARDSITEAIKSEDNRKASTKKALGQLDQAITELAKYKKVGKPKRKNKTRSK